MATNDNDELCGHLVVQRSEDGRTVELFPCARVKGHALDKRGSGHRTAQQIENRRLKAAARYNALAETERSELNRKKNRARTDRQP